MNLKSTDYNQLFLNTLQGGQAYNDAPKYGVKIQSVEVAEGEFYWRAVGVHHLLPAENGGDHTILVEALDEQGNRIRQGKIWAARTWENNAEPPEAKALDKGSGDPAGCDFPMNFGQTNSVWIQGDRRDARDPSDRVEKIHTRHDDEPDGNTRGHHSFYVVFQRTRKAPTALDEAAVLAAARKLLNKQLGEDSPFAVYAREHDLGAPITEEFRAGGYRARGYVGGIVFAPIAKPDEIKHMAWR